MKRILPDILPPNPKDAIKGTELIQLVKYRLNQEYSDATLRYHFSIMSCDPSAPIAKVDQGQGYYLRTNTLKSMSSARHIIPAQAGSGDEYGYTSNEALYRANKFRAIVARINSVDNRFPFILQETFGEDAVYESLWNYPDLVLVDWEIAKSTGRGSGFDRDLLELRRSFGSQPFTLRSVKMKLETRADTFREDFFQCLSNSRWAHFGELIIAEPVTDDSLVEELRGLGSEFGIGITSYGLDAEALNDLPEPGAIRAFGDSEIKDLEKRLTIQKICTPRPRTEIDWRQIRALRAENEELESMFRWLTSCLDSGKAISFEDFQANPPVPSDKHDSLPAGFTQPAEAEI
ncbi:MAG: hypothetical protein ACR2RV_24460 [Verrucomicrobiales bacterium]